MRLKFINLKLVLVTLCMIVLSACSNLSDTNYSIPKTISDTNNSTAQNGNISSTISPTQGLELFNAYLKDIEEQTHRTIGNEQRKLLLDYVSKNHISKIDKNTLATHRKDFDKNRSKLIKEWEQHTGLIWPTYTENVLNDKGKVLRKKGNNYDAHHVIELAYGGLNEWWNLTPAAFPNEHQGGIHRKGGVASKLFDEVDD